MEQSQNNAIGRDAIEWESESFVYQENGFFWYIGMLLGSVVVSSVPWLISGRKDYLSSIIIFVSLLALIVYAARKPKVRKYRLSPASIHIEAQNFSLLDFAYYWVEKFDNYTQITLVGRKRTAMPVGLYIKDEEILKKVVGILEKVLPQTNPSNNPADWLARKLKL